MTETKTAPSCPSCRTDHVGTIVGTHHYCLECGHDWPGIPISDMKETEGLQIAKAFEPERMRLTAIVLSNKIKGLSARNAELEAECRRLRILTAPEQTEGTDDPRITFAAELLIEADIRFQELFCVLANAVHRIRARDDAKVKKVASILERAVEDALFNGAAPEMLSVSARSVVKTTRDPS